MNDLYPSRCGGSRLVQRVDQIIDRSRIFPGSISFASIKEYERKGFIILGNVFNLNEISHIKKSIFSLRDYYENIVYHELGNAMDMRVILENDDNKKISPSPVSLKSIWQIHLSEDESPHMGSAASLSHDLARDARFIDPARQILGEEVYIHQSRINFQPGWNENSSGGGFLWHQDFEQWHCDDGMPRMRAISIALLLEDAMPANGALMVIPGSHKWMVQTTVPPNYDNYSKSALSKGPRFQAHYLREFADQSGIVHCNGKAGDMIIFDCNIIHGSHTNISPWGRSMVFFVYNAISNTLEIDLVKGAVRPEYIACRDTSHMGIALSPTIPEYT